MRYKEIKISEYGVGIVTKQNATKDVPVGGEYMNVKKLGLDKKPKKKTKSKLKNEAHHLKNPKNTFLTKADTAYDFIRVGKTISNLKNAPKDSNRDEPDVMVVPYGGKKEKDHLKKGLNRVGYKTQDADKDGDDAHVDEDAHSGDIKKVKFDADLKLPNGKDIVLQADDDEYTRGLVIRSNADGSYDSYYWYNDPKKKYPIEVQVDGKSVSKDAKNVHWKYHPELKENFADGKKKGKSRPGRVKKSGASCKGSVTDLRKRAKGASGEKRKMYHWCANMKSGKK